MNVVGKVGSLISQGVYSVATPFHPFGGAVDVIVVQQQDGTFRSTPWYVRFGKFQGVLKGALKAVHITVNGIEVDFHMCLDNSGEAYFVKEVDAGTNGGMQDSDCEVGQNDGNKHIAQFCRLEHSVSESGVALLRDELDSINLKRLERTESDTRFYEFQDDQSSLEDSVNFSEFGLGQYDCSDGACLGEAQDLGSEVVLVSVDGHILTVPVSEQNDEDVHLSTPKFHIEPCEGPECCKGNDIISGDNACTADCSNKLGSIEGKDSSHNVCSVNIDSTALRDVPEVSQDGREHACQTEQTQNISDHQSETESPSDVGDASPIKKRGEVFRSCLELSELGRCGENTHPGDTNRPVEDHISQDTPSCSPPDVDESKDGAVGDSRNEDVSSSSNINGYPDLPVENKVSDSDYLGSSNVSVGSVGNESQGKDEQFDTSASTKGISSSPQCPEPMNESSKSECVEPETPSGKWIEALRNSGFEISLCGNKLHAGMGLDAAAAVFDAHRVSKEEYRNNARSVIKNPNLIVRFGEKYLPWEKAASVILGMAAFKSEVAVDPQDAVPVEQEESSNPKDDIVTSTSSSCRWKLWPIPFTKGKRLEHSDSNASSEEVFVDTESDLQNSLAGPALDSSRKQVIRTNVPTTEQIASMNLKDGQNVITFSFSTRVFGNQQVEAHLYLWKWNDKIVISDVDGTITKSDVLGQFMPLVGRDWTQSGVAKLFSAIKENGYQMLFLSARAIVQAYITRNYLLNLKQDGKALPNGPVVISPDGLFPSLYREVIRRAPHEFKIACLEDIKKLFPSDHNPFYAGFGNRDTDELSYRKIGIPKGKIFIINPKGEVAISQRTDERSYTSLHTLVDDMFPPASMVEQEDFNSWNFWKVPLPDVE